MDCDGNHRRGGNPFQSLRKPPPADSLLEAQRIPPRFGGVRPRAPIRRVDDAFDALIAEMQAFRGMARMAHTSDKTTAGSEQTQPRLMTAVPEAG